MPRKTIVPVPGFPKPAGIWSSAVVVEAKKLLFIAGLLARNSAGRLVGVGDIREQTRQVCENLKSAVEAAGGTLADLVRVDVYITDMTMFDDIHAVRKEFFPVDPPVSTMVEIKRFTDKDALIEINAIAALP
jgi:enamine deaminase RidA (YjgF/YER057c/UK114 family)